jgi:hypothetical protein
MPSQFLLEATGWHTSSFNRNRGWVNDPEKWVNAFENGWVKVPEKLPPQVVD